MLEIFQLYPEDKPLLNTIKQLTEVSALCFYSSVHISHKIYLQFPEIKVLSLIAFQSFDITVQSEKKI